MEVAAVRLAVPALDIEVVFVLVAATDFGLVEQAAVSIAAVAVAAAATMDRDGWARQRFGIDLQ